KMAEVPGAVARLFFEFAPRCRFRGLAIKPTGRTLQQGALERMAIDVLHHHSPIGQHGHNDDKARVLNHGIGDLDPRGEGNLVLAELHPPALKQIAPATPSPSFIMLHHASRFAPERERAACLSPYALRRLLAQDSTDMVPHSARRRRAAQVGGAYPTIL